MMKKLRFILPASFAAGAVLGAVAVLLSVGQGAGRDGGERRDGTLPQTALERPSDGKRLPKRAERAGKRRTTDERRTSGQEAEDEPMVEIVRDEEGLTDEERAERFARDNPEEAARRAELRKRRFARETDRENGKLRFLASLDETCFSAEDWGAHVAYVEALGARQAAMERIGRAVAAGRRGADEDLATCAEMQGRLAAAAEGERRALLAATARSAGFKEESVADFLALVDEIDAATGRRVNLNQTRHEMESKP